MSPELFDPKIEDHRRTKYSDCYALGMVIYEVLSRHIPFHKDPNLVVVVKVVNGGRPERPKGAEGIVWFTDDVWGALERCWTSRPENRPSLEDILQCMEKASGSWTPPSLVSVTAPSTVGSPTWDTSDLSNERSMDDGGIWLSSQLSDKQLSIISVTDGDFQPQCLPQGPSMPRSGSLFIQVDAVNPRGFHLIPAARPGLRIVEQTLYRPSDIRRAWARSVTIFLYFRSLRTYVCLLVYVSLTSLQPRLVCSRFLFSLGDFRILYSYLLFLLDIRYSPTFRTPSVFAFIFRALRLVFLSISHMKHIFTHHVARYRLL